MIWLDNPCRCAPSLPAVWCIDTPVRPANLRERADIRRHVAEQVVSTQLGIASSAVKIAHNAAGRPILSQHGDLAISYATRDGMVIVALAETPIGADIELIEPQPDIPWNILHVSERDELRRTAGVGRSQAFYRLWTAKEAWLKAHGTGLLTEPSSFAICFQGESARHATDGRFQIETRLIQRGADVFAAAVAFQP